MTDLNSYCILFKFDGTKYRDFAISDNETALWGSILLILNFVYRYNSFSDITDLLVHVFEIRGKTRKP